MPFVDICEYRVEAGRNFNGGGAALTKDHGSAPKYHFDNI